MPRSWGSERWYEGDRPVDRRVDAEQEGQYGKHEARPEEDHEAENQGCSAPVAPGLASWRRASSTFALW